MKRYSVDELTFEAAELFGERVLFSELRIQRDSVPEGLRLYELRHGDEDDASPCQISRGILVNFYGSILTSRPVQLHAVGCLGLRHEDFWYLDNAMTVREYLAQYPPQDADIMELSAFQDGTQSLFFTGSAEDDRKNRCIGHLRGDFGDNGEQFYATWWESGSHSLNTPAFKTDLARVMKWLQQDDAPLKSFHEMESFCLYRGCARLPSENPAAYGFEVDTKAYQYKLRCVPHKGEYHCKRPL